jgi:hypothetical protein
MSQPAVQVTGSAPAEPVPVAFLGRTSTLLLQDPAASLRRQAREVQAKLPPGWFIAAWFWDIESGGLDIEQRGHGTAHQAVDVGLPRDGGLAALLAEAAPSAHPAARRSYLLRSRCRCRGCKRPMAGRLVRPYAGHPGYIYYGCPHNPLNPRHQAQAPDHPRTVRVREDDLLNVIRQFFATHVFGPDRAAMLAEHLPASAAEDTARREQETARLHKRLRKIDAAENAHAREIENLASLPQGSPAITALHTRIIARFGELEAERTQINDRLAALDRATGQQDDPALLDALPLLGDALPSLPASIQARLFAAFGLELIYNKEDHQVTIYATVTPSTPGALAEIIARSEPPTVPADPAGSAHSPQHTRMSSLAQPRQTAWRVGFPECGTPHLGRWADGRMARQAVQVAQCLT